MVSTIDYGVQGPVLLTVGRSYVGNDVTHSTLLDRARACSYENLPKYRSYRVGNTAPCSVVCMLYLRRVLVHEAFQSGVGARHDRVEIVEHVIRPIHVLVHEVPAEETRAGR